MRIIVPHFVFQLSSPEKMTTFYRKCGLVPTVRGSGPLSNLNCKQYVNKELFFLSVTLQKCNMFQINPPNLPSTSKAPGPHCCDYNHTESQLHQEQQYTRYLQWLPFAKCENPIFNPNLSVSCCLCLGF